MDDGKVPPYAILSHTWESGEITYAHLRDIPDLLDRDTAAQHTNDGELQISKVRNACLKAKDEKLDYIWVDTCCINKDSDSELSEAINSMYRWYQKAEICLVYMWDVPDDVDCMRPKSGFTDSKWFTRGWTLQELIAPAYGKFFSGNWKHIGTKSIDLNDNRFCRKISKITGVEMRVLLDSTTLEDVSAARKMSWAAKRQTTRLEDRAYSLLGLFGVNMPMIYGEGLKSFQRLQEEIIKSSTDETLFLWKADTGDTRTASGLLAQSPDDFRDSDEFIDGILVRSDPFWMTNRGLCLRVELTRREYDEEMEGYFYVAILNGTRNAPPAGRPNVGTGLYLRRLEEPYGNVFERIRLHADLDTVNGVDPIWNKGDLTQVIFVRQRTNHTQETDKRQSDIKVTASLHLLQDHPSCQLQDIDFIDWERWKSHQSGDYLVRIDSEATALQLQNHGTLLSRYIEQIKDCLVAIFHFVDVKENAIIIGAFADASGDVKLTASAQSIDMMRLEGGNSFKKPAIAGCGATEIDMSLHGVQIRVQVVKDEGCFDISVVDFASLNPSLVKPFLPKRKMVHRVR